MSTASDVKTGADADARAFIAEHEKTIRPLERQAALTWWNANVTGRDQDFQAKEEAQNRLDAALADREASPGSRRSRRARSATQSWPGRSRCSTWSTWRSRSIPSSSPDHGQGQRHREGIQCLSREGQRPEMTDSEVRRVLKESRTRPSARPSGRGARGSARWSRPTSRHWSSCATRRRASSGFPTTTPCSFISTSSRRSRCSSCSTSSTC